ncbi:uncharacterized protein LOC106769596 isoform X2 [Vigna radiata var. radiata]|uniref:Uncharacterized protein LOC106769596 isoform X2 n=1 Tax=Vigna radiata var. radiata TaxID=3916 RepID=A0A3Q0FB27_VIGRR|nr:uncharacterized protein LOC106769596 isoform X2 [Vigna radiata var. radiata]
MQLQDASVGKMINFIASHVVTASFAGIISEQSREVVDHNIIPHLRTSGSGRLIKIEKFSHYVARQMGLEEGEVPALCRLADEYLIKWKECEESVVEYFSDQKDPTLSGKLIDEFERCILSYFAFHWNHASYVISQVLSAESPEKKELKKFLLAATRSFWSGTASNPVVVEADAFKERDVIFKALSSRGHHDDMLQTAELVHQSSTDAASSLLVTALNEGRDVIMDGTLSWEPFVQQTIAMARNVHKYKYRMGVGYKVSEDSTIVTENYWEQVNEGHQPQTRKPYRIELVGVVCDGYLAVVRGIRRAIMTRRAVRVNSQLQSHQRFANAFPNYCKLVDDGRLYCTNAIGGPPKLIWWKEIDHNMPDLKEIDCLKMMDRVNVEADSIYELYKEPSLIMKPGSVWKDIVLSPSRSNDQKKLRKSIQKIEKSIRKQ